MRYRIVQLTLIAAALAVAGCGSSSSSSSKSTPTAAKPPTSSTAAGSATGAAVKARTYNVKLAGSAEVPKASPGNTARAVISIRSKTNQLCWKFSSLKGVTAPAVAHIHKGRAGVAGPIVIPLGGAYKASGCTSAPAALLSQIGANQSGFYVNIHNAKYPAGAVRAQL
ncbi:MAG: CHRD domain-containing protein [Solirubrobacteraceae bacterium]